MKKTWEEIFEEWMSAAPDTLLVSPVGLADLLGAPEEVPPSLPPGLEGALCSDCDAAEGEIHELGCDMEVCPFCGTQLITCYCSYERLGLRDRERYPAETDYLSAEVFEHGLSKEQEAQWEALLNQQGRDPLSALAGPVRPLRNGTTISRLTSSTWSCVGPAMTRSRD